MKFGNVLNAVVIRRLLKRLYQVLAVLLANLSTSSPHLERLRLLLFSFRRFVTTNFRCLSRHSTDSNLTEAAPESCHGTLASACNGWCAQATSPLPFHGGQTTPVTAATTSQHLASPSPVHSIPTFVPSISQQATTYRTSLHAEVNGLNGSCINIKFTPIHARNNLRHEERPHAKKSIKYDVLPKLTRKFSNESCHWLKGVTGWQSYVHPEGALYFHNKDRSTFTEANMDENAFCLVNECVDELYRQLAGEVEIEDNGIELFLQVAEVSDTDASCQYYFVDHADRTLFWLQDHDEVTADIFSGLQGIYDLSHIAYALESEYWTHCERYPIHELDRVKLIKELRELVMYARAETITSDTSLSPFGADELSGILDLISHLEVNAEDEDSPHSICIIARFMHYFSRSKFFNFCGLPCARLDADKSVYEELTSSFHPVISGLSLVLDAMLFWSPQVHYDELRKVWVDECIIEPRWKDFSRNLMAEWNGITIYSTVMLAVDVSLLAVPNVDIQTSQSFGVIATYLSTIFITGSLIASLLLARQTQKYRSAEGAARLLRKMTKTFFGMKALATVHSLPYAMLLWGMIFFAISFLYNVLKSTTVATLASVISGCMVVTMFMLWFIWAARDVHIFKRLTTLIRDFSETCFSP